MFSEQLISRLKSAQSVVVLTGAGISAESGVPTFRGENGIWKKFKPEELANFDAFIRNPELVWEWYNHRKKIIHGVQPNPGHYALAAMESIFKDFAVITQNVDNLHRKAGSKRVYELHGNIERSYCLECRRSYSDVTVDETSKIPRCEKCNGIIRPDVVWFGEMLPEEEVNGAVAAAEGADVFFSVGTSAVVYPAASLPLVAKRNGAYTTEINAEMTEISDLIDETILGKSGEILPKLVEILRKELHSEN
jgi:NAD-dependent deacetylase